MGASPQHSPFLHPGLQRHFAGMTTDAVPGPGMGFLRAGNVNSSLMVSPSCHTPDTNFGKVGMLQAAITMQQTALTLQPQATLTALEGSTTPVVTSNLLVNPTQVTMAGAGQTHSEKRKRKMK